MARPFIPKFFASYRIVVSGTAPRHAWSMPNIAGPSRPLASHLVYRAASSAAAKAPEGVSEAGRDEPGQEAIPLAAPVEQRPADARLADDHEGGNDPARSEWNERTKPLSTSRKESASAHPLPTIKAVSLDERIEAIRQNAKRVYTKAEERARFWSLTVGKRSREKVDQLQSELGRLSWRINEATGYEEIDKLKALVAQREDELQASRDAAKAAKTAYDAAVTSRSTAQASVNSLLERKHLWTDADVSTFTSLIRSDHSSTAAVSRTSAELDAAESRVDKSFSALTQSILRRYHEEQVWSDKIRSFSTWASITGLAINLVVFLTAIVLVEPWKRRKMAEGIEGRMARMMESVESRISGLREEIVASAVPVSVAVEKGGHVPVVSSSETIINATPDSQDHPISTQDASRASTNFAPSPSPSHPQSPRITTILPTPPESLAMLAPLTVPSHDRDLAIATAAGIAVGAVFCALIGSAR